MPVPARALAPVLLLLAACQDNALKRVETDSAAPPELTVSPEAIDFGASGPGEPRTEVFTLTSVGGGAVHLADVRVYGSTAFTLAALSETTIEPGDSMDVAVTWDPQSYDDDAHVQIDSDAVTAQLQVSLTGQGLYPGIEVDPASMSFTSTYGEEAVDMLTVRSVGAVDLVVSQTLLTGASFAIQTDTPDGAFTLAPGEQRSFPVTYTPPGEDDTSTGNVWFSTNTADPSVVVPLFGETGVPCYGLGEAWDRGLLGVTMSAVGALIVHNASTDTPVCMDQWYVFLSDDSQDALAGDTDYDLSGDYPFGSITIDPGTSQAFSYGRLAGDAWWCMEHEQYTQASMSYTFFGARAPGPLLDRALAGDQDGLWARQEDEPVVVVGRTRQYLGIDGGESGQTGLRALNVGDVGVSADLSETVPAGFVASGFSVAPDVTVVNGDGSTTYGWTVALDARTVVAGHGNTTYDTVDVTYTLTRSGACAGTVTAPEATATWSDRDGAEVSTANPLVVRCH